MSADGRHLQVLCPSILNMMCTVSCHANHAPPEAHLLGSKSSVSHAHQGLQLHTCRSADVCQNPCMVGRQLSCTASAAVTRSALSVQKSASDDSAATKRCCQCLLLVNAAALLLGIGIGWHSAAWSWHHALTPGLCES